MQSNKLTVLDIPDCTLDVINTWDNPLTELTAKMNGATIKLNSNGYGSIALDYWVGDVLRQAGAAPKNPAAFINWTDNDDGGAVVSANAAFNLSAATDYNLTANFQYGVTFDKNGGATEANPAAVAADPGAKISVPGTNPTRPGHTFGGWYQEAGCVNAWAFDTDTVTANITLFAKWIPAAGDIGGGGGGGNPSDDGEKITVTKMMVRCPSRER
jgi:uncharacterized repeat protein (TIGR02543 family)